jgi:hypothetical protein
MFKKVAGACWDYVGLGLNPEPSLIYYKCCVVKTCAPSQLNSKADQNIAFYNRRGSQRPTFPALTADVKVLTTKSMSDNEITPERMYGSQTTIPKQRRVA